MSDADIAIAAADAAIASMRQAIDELEPMELARAEAIVAAINHRALAVMGIASVAQLLAPLGEVSLLDMLAAVARVNAADADAARNTRPGYPHSLHVVPDPRLIAAAYALDRWNYAEREPDDPVAVAKGADGVLRGLFVLPIEVKPA